MLEQDKQNSDFSYCHYCGGKGIGIDYNHWHCPSCSNIGDPKLIPLDQIKPLPTLTEGTIRLMSPNELERSIKIRQELLEIIAKRQKI